MENRNAPAPYYDGLVTDLTAPLFKLGRPFESASKKDPPAQTPKGRVWHYAAQRPNNSPENPPPSKPKNFAKTKKKRIAKFSKGKSKGR